MRRLSTVQPAVEKTFSDDVDAAVIPRRSRATCPSLGHGEDLFYQYVRRSVVVSVFAYGHWLPRCYSGNLFHLRGNPATPSPRYYRKFHLHNRGIPAVTAVLPSSPLPCKALSPCWSCAQSSARHIDLLRTNWLQTQRTRSNCSSVCEWQLGRCKRSNWIVQLELESSPVRVMWTRLNRPLL